MYVLGRHKIYTEKRVGIYINVPLWQKEYAVFKGWKDADLWHAGFISYVLEKGASSEILIKLSQRMREDIEERTQALVRMERYITENQIIEQAASIKKAKTRIREEWDEDEGRTIQIVEAI